MARFRLSTLFLLVTLAGMLLTIIGEGIEIVRLRRLTDALQRYINEVSDDRGECKNRVIELEKENAELRAAISSSEGP